MVAPKTEEAIELLRINGQLTSRALAEVGKAVAPGVTTMQLNKVAETFIRDNGAVPNFLGYDGYPAAICASVNDVVVHGFPSDYVLKEGDIVSIDLGTKYKGYNGDSAGHQGRGARLVEGMTICIEPMITAGDRHVYLAKNGWAVHTVDHKKAAHFELTVVVRKGHAEQLSTFEFIEKEVGINF